MSIRVIPDRGPTALGLIADADREQPAQQPLAIPYGAKAIKPVDHFCETHGDCQIVAEFGKIDILSCGCEFDTRG